MHVQFSERIHVFGKVILKLERKFSFLSYLITGAKNVLIDTVPGRVAAPFLDELNSVLPLSKLDAIILNHSEEDHSGALAQLHQRIPSVPIYCTENCKVRLLPVLPDAPFVTVQSGSSLALGDLHFHFIHTPGLHWDDNMVTYLEHERILFSNDLFGQSTGAESPTDAGFSADEIRAAAEAYFNQVFSSATSEQRRVVLTLPLQELKAIAPGHGVILQAHLQSVLDFYRAACQ